MFSLDYLLGILCGLSIAVVVGSIQAFVRRVAASNRLDDSATRCEKPETL